MSRVYLIIATLILAIVGGVAGHFEFRTKALQIERSAGDRGATLSDDEQAEIKKYRSLSENSLKMTVLSVIGCVLLLLQATVSM